MTVAGVETFHGDAGRDAFLARTDILVCLVPLTPETRGILAMPLFQKLATDGALGRGPSGHFGSDLLASLATAYAPPQGTDGRRHLGPWPTCRANRALAILVTWRLH